MIAVNARRLQFGTRELLRLTFSSLIIFYSG